MSDDDFERAGMVDEERGGLGRVAPAEQIDALLSCRLERDGSDRDLIVYDARERTTIDASPDLLNQFVRLADADAEGVLKFAKRWGALQLCSRGMPFLHPRTGDCPGDDGCFWRQYPEGSQSHKFGFDTVDRWLRWARYFRMLIEVTRDLANNTRPSEDNLIRLMPTVHPWRVDRYKGRFYAVTVSSEKGGTSFGFPLWFDVANEINSLLRLAACQPRLECDASGKRGISLGGHGSLFGALTVKLLMATSAERGFEFCSHCTQTYEIKGRKPRKGERHFCPECQDAGVPARLATNRYRAKRRESTKRTRSVRP